MYCSYCGCKVKDDVKYCYKCGKSLENIIEEDGKINIKKCETHLTDKVYFDGKKMIKKNKGKIEKNIEISEGKVPVLEEKSFQDNGVIENSKYKIGKRNPIIYIYMCLLLLGVAIGVYAINDGAIIEDNTFNENKLVEDNGASIISSNDTINQIDSSLNLKTIKLLKTIANSGDSIGVLSCSHDGKYIISGGKDSTVKIWGMETGNLVNTLKGKELENELGVKWNVSSVSYSLDDRYILSGNHGNTIRIWEATSGKVLMALKCYGAKSVYSPDGNNIASVGMMGHEIKIWDSKTGNELRKTIYNDSYWINSVDYSSDGKNIISACNDGIIRIWDVKTGNLLKSISAHAGDVYRVAYSPNGKEIVSMGKDCKINIWKVTPSSIVKVHQWNGNHVNAIAYSPDNKYIVMNNDNKVNIWYVETGELLGTLSEQAENVEAITFTPDGKNIILGSSDGSIQIWGN